MLDAQPGVLESAVIGVQHRDLGETVIEVIVAEPGEAPDLDRIIAAVQKSLAQFKQPRKLATVPELQRDTMAKVQKNILGEELKDAFHVV